MMATFAKVLPKMAMQDAAQKYLRAFVKSIKVSKEMCWPIPLVQATVRRIWEVKAKACVFVS